MHVSDVNTGFSLTLESFVEGHLLTVVGHDRKIEDISIAGHVLTEPVAGFCGIGETSMWMLPRGMRGTAVLRSKHGDGQTCLDDVTLTPCALDQASCEIRVELVTESDGWGLLVQPRLRLLDAASGKPQEVLPANVLGLSIEIQRNGRAPLRRSVPMMSPLVKGNIARIFQVSMRIMAETAKTKPGKRLTRDELAREILRPENQLFYLKYDGLLSILDAIETERRAAGDCLLSLGSGQGRDGADIAWQQAAPALVAQRLTRQQIEAAGLVPTGRDMVLDPLRLSHDSTLRIVNVPDRMTVTLAHEDGESRPQAYGAVRIDHDTVTWAAGEAERSEAALQIALARHPVTANAAFVRGRRAPLVLPEAEVSAGDDKPAGQDWTARLRAHLEDRGHLLHHFFEQDARQIKASPPAPAWLAGQVRPAPSTLSALRGQPLYAPALWASDHLPAAVRQQVFTYVFRNLWPSAGMTALPADMNFDESSTAFATLAEVDRSLSGDRRYDATVLERAARLPAAASGNDTARFVLGDTADSTRKKQAAALLLVGALGADNDGADFLAALHGGDAAAAARAARDTLDLHMAPRAVGK